jgi:hypothetical protein
MNGMKFGGWRLKAYLIALVTLASLFMSPGSFAQAQNSPHRRTVVMRLDFEGSVNEVGRDQLARRLFEGLASAGFQVFSADETVARLFLSNPQLKSCEQASCFMQMAAALQANFLVVGRVEAKRRDYDIMFRLVDGRTGELLETTKQRCDVCGIQEAGDTVNQAASSLRSGLDKVEAPAQVTFETRPSGTLVESDGQPLGFTPLTQELSVGVHQLTLSKPGYKPVSRSIAIAPGSAQSISMDLQEQPGPFLSPGWKTAGWVSLTTGVVALAVGGYLLKLDGQGTNCSEVFDPALQKTRRACADKYDSRLAIASLLPAGGILTGVGGLVLFVAPGVVQTNTLKSDAGQSTAQLNDWQLTVRGRF